MSSTKLEELLGLIDERVSLLTNQFNNKTMITPGIIEIGECIIFIDAAFIYTYFKDFRTFENGSNIDSSIVNDFHVHVEDQDITKTINEQIQTFITHLNTKTGSKDDQTRKPRFQLLSHLYLKHYSHLINNYTEQYKKTCNTDIENLRQATMLKLKKELLNDFKNEYIHKLLYLCHKQHPQGFTFGQWIDFLELNLQS